LKINQIHPYIKFTMTHTTPSHVINMPCSCERVESIPFLDTLCTIENGRIRTKLYRKPTDKNQYLLPSSCHPEDFTKNIPFSLALRINRICSEEEDREKGYLDLKNMLRERNYPTGIIEGAIAKSRAIPRETALKQSVRQDSTDRPVFVALFDPRHPSIPNITRKHWKSMVSQDNYLKEVFPEPPLVAYKRQANIKDKIIKAKVPKILPNYPQRIKKGMKKCGKNTCAACPYIKTGTKVKGKKFTWNITKEYNCRSRNVIYIIECTKDNCKERYIGETERMFKERIYDHIGYVKNKNESQATGLHFNKPGHSVSDMKFTVIEGVKKNDKLYRKEREKQLINKFNTYHEGINRMP